MWTLVFDSQQLSDSAWLKCTQMAKWPTSGSTSSLLWVATYLTPSPRYMLCYQGSEVGDGRPHSPELRSQCLCNSKRTTKGLLHQMWCGEVTHTYVNHKAAVMVGLVYTAHWRFVSCCSAAHKLEQDRLRYFFVKVFGKRVSYPCQVPYMLLPWKGCTYTVWCHPMNVKLGTVWLGVVVVSTHSTTTRAYIQVYSSIVALGWTTQQSHSSTGI